MKHPLRQLAQTLIEVRELKREVKRSQYETKSTKSKALPMPVLPIKFRFTHLAQRKDQTT